MTNYTEWTDSQKPALNLLRKLGWQYISPEETEKERGHILSNVILEDILKTQLNKINSFEYKSKTYPFSQSNILSAVNNLKNEADVGLVTTNKNLYDHLTLGKSFTETIDGDQKGYTLKYIDWDNLDNNVFHVTKEFYVEGVKENRRADICLFVNGIPFVVIENKRRDKLDALDDAIDQLKTYQQKEEGIPRLFHFLQLLIAAQPNEAKYAVTGSKKEFWSVWKEDNTRAVEKLLKSKTHKTEPEDRLATAQDRTLFALCQRDRLLDLVYKFIVFDGTTKKIARYQQFFAVRDTLKRVHQTDQEGVRKGGVIWHTQGSGKSLTMVMLAKSLALDPEIPSPRVLVVTDRISLDKQIHDTFVSCGKGESTKKATSGSDLIDLLKDKGVEIITSIVDKFQTALKRQDFKDSSKNLFVLVDESHRSQYGTANIKMRKMLPNATYIGFTGTPLLKKDKNTARKFGGFIHKYTIDQAVKDEAVLPLLYEGRSAKLSLNKEQIDRGFERLSETLSEEAQKDLKQKFSSISRIYESEQVVEEIARDISEHFQQWRGTGMKAQLAVPKINTAVRYQKYFEQQLNPELKINTRVVFTAPDNRKSGEDVWEDANEEAKRYWKKLMEEQGAEKEKYEENTITLFKEPSDEVEIIIVVSKLLTGFDAPRNSILYLAKPLKEHNLLQAIARVNRVFEGKDHGLIIDYVGVLGKLDEALTAYSAFDGFDEEDLEGTITNITEEIRKLPSKLDSIWDLFKEVSNKKDSEALEQHLLPKDLRDQFYERVKEYAKSFQLAITSDEFFNEFSHDQIDEFKSQLKEWVQRRSSVQLRYAERISYKEYEPRLRKLLDTYVGADYIEKMTGEVNIFDENMVKEALASYGKTPASKADMIAHNMKRVLTEIMEKDEAFYKKFSEMIEDTINAFNEGRIDEKEYLESIKKIRDDLEAGHQEGVPEELTDKAEARAFYGAINEVIMTTHGEKETTAIQTQLAQAGLQISELVRKLTIRDWKRNTDVQNKMENEIEDYLIEHRKSMGIEITFDEIDDILSKCLKVAKHNY